jgi:hypothetical protein
VRGCQIVSKVATLIHRHDTGRRTEGKKIISNFWQHRKEEKYHLTTLRKAEGKNIIANFVNWQPCSLSVTPRGQNCKGLTFSILYLRVAFGGTWDFLSRKIEQICPRRVLLLGITFLMKIAFLVEHLPT